MKIRTSEDKVMVNLVCNLDDGYGISKNSEYGFVVRQDDRSCYIVIGSKRDLVIRLEKMNGDLLAVFLDLMVSSNDEIMAEIADVIRELENSIIFNWEEVTPYMIDHALGEIGIKDND